MSAGCDPTPSDSTTTTTTSVSVDGITLNADAGVIGRRPALKRIAPGMYADHSQGIEVGVEGTEQGERVCYVLLRWDDPSLKFHDPKAAGHQPFSGTLLLGKRPVTFSKSSTEADVSAFLGEPYWRDADETETLVFYELSANVELQVEFGPGDGGTLRVLMATNDPLLAKAEQRMHFKVTKPWPPEF